MDHLYETTAINEDGVSGESYIYDGDTFHVSNPLSEEPGANPEKFVGLALSTCLNSTVQAILKEAKLANPSRTEVTVQLHPEKEEVGYFFTIHAKVSIKDMALDQAKDYLSQAKARCPMSKLFSESYEVTYEAVPYSS